MSGEGGRGKRLFTVGLSAALLASPVLRGCWDMWSWSLVSFLMSGLCAAAILIAFLRPPPEASDDFWVTLFETAWPLGLFLGAGLVSALLSPFAHSALRGFGTDLCAAAMFYGAVSAGENQDNIVLRVLLAGVVGGACVTSVGTSFLSLPNPNALSALLLLGLPFFIYKSFRDFPSSPWKYWAALAACLTLALACTSSFWALVVLGAETAVLGRLFIPRQARALGKGTLIALVLLGSLGAALAFKEHLWVAPLKSDRWQWWVSAANMWARNPLWGVGPGAFGEAFPGYHTVLWRQNTLYAHNFILEMLAERGILGAGAFVLFLSCLWMRYKKARAHRPLPPVVAAGLVSLAGFLAFNLGNIGFSIPGLQWLFWAMTGWAWSKTGLEARHLGHARGCDAPLYTDEERRCTTRRSPDRGLHPIYLLPGGRVLKNLLIGGFLLCVLWAGLTFRLFKGDQGLARARFAVAQNDWVSAQRRLEGGLFWNAKEPELYSLQAAVFARRNDWRGAETALDEAVRLSPFSARFLEERGDVAAQTRDLQGAVDFYGAAVKALPLSPRLWLKSGQSLQERGNFPGALESYQNALKACGFSAREPQDAVCLAAARCLQAMNERPTLHVPKD